MRAAQPRARARPAHARQPHGRRPRRRRPARRCCARCSERGHPVVWACDPMHGNTFSHASGYKTRHFDDVMRELRRRSSPRATSAGVWPGGVHVELTGENVTECLGGTEEVLGDAPRAALRDDVRSAAQRPPVARPRVPDRRAAAPLSRLADATGDHVAHGDHGDRQLRGPRARTPGWSRRCTAATSENPESVVDHWRDFFADYAPRGAGRDPAAAAGTRAAPPAPRRARGAGAAAPRRRRRRRRRRPGPIGPRRRERRAAARRRGAHRREHGGEPRGPDRDVGADRAGEAARGQPPDPEQPPRPRPARGKVSFTHLIAFAVLARARRRCPAMNSGVRRARTASRSSCATST